MVRCSSQRQESSGQSRFDGVKKKSRQLRRPGRDGVSCSCSICARNVHTLGFRCWKQVIHHMLTELATAEDPWVSTRQMCEHAEAHWYRLWNSESIPKRVHWQRTLTMTLSKGNGTRYENGRDQKGTKGFWKLLEHPGDACSRPPGNGPKPTLLMSNPEIAPAQSAESFAALSASPATELYLPERSSSLDVLAEVAESELSSSANESSEGASTPLRTRFQSDQERSVLPALTPRSGCHLSLPSFGQLAMQPLVTHTNMVPRANTGGVTTDSHNEENSRLILDLPQLTLPN